MTISQVQAEALYTIGRQMRRGGGGGLAVV